MEEEVTNNPVETEAAEPTAAEVSEPTPPAENEPTPPTPGESEELKPLSLLDDEGEGEEKSEAQESAPPAPNEEETKAFYEKLSAVDLGDGVTRDDELLKEMTPALMAMTNGDPKKAEGIVNAYASFVKAKEKRELESQILYENALVKQCEAEFGADAKRVAKMADFVGSKILGEEWKAMRSVKSFFYNPNVIRRLSSLYSMFAQDTGKMPPNGEAATIDRGDVFHRLYGNVKV